METINQKEYLKKYLGIGRAPGEKKKKKKPKGVSDRVKIIDDDADTAIVHTITEEELRAQNEDAPQIVAIIDERPPSLRVDDKTKNPLWQPIGSIDSNATTGQKQTIAGFKINSLKSNDKQFAHPADKSASKKSKAKQTKNEDKTITIEDNSPPRNGTMSINNGSPSRKSRSDGSPSRRPKTDYSPERNADVSPPRRSRTEDNSPRRRKSEDISPPRRSRRNDDDDTPPRKSRNEDISPPRRRKSEDSSPPRRSRRNDDISPPRKSRRNEDISPPRRRRSEDISPPRKRRNNEDISPVRRSRKNEDISPPRRRKSADSSPSKKRRNNEDISPPRRRKSNDSSPPRRRNPLKSEEGRIREENSERRVKKMDKTLDGKTAGLQDAKQLVEETQVLRQCEDQLFKNLSKEQRGENAETVFRDRKSGKIRNLEEEEEHQRKKQEEEAKKKEKYSRWGRGLVQVENRNEQIQQELYEMSKPLARYADDEDLERYLKEQEREGDPMLQYIRKKKRKKLADAGVTLKPEFEGNFMPNRFGIKPGHRWDGVDRSNGYEKRWFEVQNAKTAQQEDVYKWSTEDM